MENRLTRFYKSSHEICNDTNTNNLFYFMKLFLCTVCAGKKVKLSLAAEEVALFFAQMLDHEYTSKKVFRENFLKDWRKVK